MTSFKKARSVQVTEKGESAAGREQKVVVATQHFLDVKEQERSSTTIISGDIDSV